MLGKLRPRCTAMLPFNFVTHPPHPMNLVLIVTGDRQLHCPILGDFWHQSSSSAIPGTGGDGRRNRRSIQAKRCIYLCLSFRTSLPLSPAFLSITGSVYPFTESSTDTSIFGSRTPQSGIAPPILITLIGLVSFGG